MRDALELVELVWAAELEGPCDGTVLLGGGVGVRDGELASFARSLRLRRSRSLSIGGWLILPSCGGLWRLAPAPGMPDWLRSGAPWLVGMPLVGLTFKADEGPAA
jgi:hypothetical protein